MATTTARKILVVDDDVELRTLLAAVLRKHGYDATVLADARRIDFMLEYQRPHLLVLDLMLPGEDGLSVCRRLRARGDDIPIVMLTARDESVDHVVGLEMGADDYVGKPFDARVLLARIEAVLRRPRAVPLAATREDDTLVTFGRFVFDRRARVLHAGKEDVALSAVEHTLLSAFVDQAFRPIKRETLAQLASEHGSDVAARSIDVQVFRLRQIVEDDPKRPRFIRTVWGVGYVFTPTGIT